MFVKVLSPGEEELIHSVSIRTSIDGNCLKAVIVRLDAVEVVVRIPEATVIFVTNDSGETLQTYPNRSHRGKIEISNGTSERSNNNGNQELQAHQGPTPL